MLLACGPVFGDQVNTSSCQSGDNGDIATESYWDGSSNSYCYDDLNRIRAVSGAIPESFALDPYGNITQYTAFNGSAVPFPVTAGNQLSGSGYATDAAGDLTAVPANANLGSSAHSFSYFATGEMHSVDGTYNYLYDGLDRRFEDSWPTAERHFFYAGTSERQIAMEPYQTGEPWIDYVWLGNERVAEIFGGAPRYFFTDQVGSTVLVADAGGNTMAGWPHKYTAFGMDDPHYVPPTGERERFAGKERDPESGMDYFEARHFGSTVGRFVSPDPLSGAVEDPSTLNKYAYARDNPLSLTDPTGLFAWSVKCSDDGACLAQEAQEKAALASKARAANDVKTQTQQQSSDQDQQNHQADQNQKQTPVPALGPKGGGKGKGERRHTAKPDDPGKHARPVPGKPGRWQVRDPHTGKWVEKPPGWSPNTKRVIFGIGVGVTGYLIYRGIRMLPSVAFPPLWPTIPANAAIP